MMARSFTRSNQKPDTLMQDRIRWIDETSCTARPDHTYKRVKTRGYRTAAIRRGGRVEDGRGSLGHAATLRFPSPAHRTGRADFPHPALRLASS